MSKAKRGKEVPTKQGTGTVINDKQLIGKSKGLTDNLKSALKRPLTRV